MKMLSRCRIYIFLCLSLLSLCSCTDRGETKKTVGLKKRQTVSFPGIGSELSSYAIVHYVDSLGCTSCKLRIDDWVNIIEKVNAEKKVLKVIFVAHPKVFPDVCKILQGRSKDFVVLNDENMDWLSKNKIPQSSMYQTFMTNAYGKIMIVGNPVMNEQVKKLMLDNLK